MIKCSNILLVGKFNVGSSNIAMADALENLDLSVTRFDFSIERPPLLKPLYKACSFLRTFDNVPILMDLYFKLPLIRQTNENLENLIQEKKFDLIIFCKAAEIRPSLLKRIKENKISKVWYFFMDPLSVGKRVGLSRYIKNSDLITATFSDVVDYLRPLNENVHQLIQGAPKPSLKKFRDFESRGIDLVFFGTALPRRRIVIKNLLEHGVNVECFGKGWPNGPIINEKLSRTLNNSRICLNLIRDGEGFSLRVLTSLTHGVPVLSEKTKDLDNYFTEEQGVFQFSSPAEGAFLLKRIAKDKTIWDQLSNNAKKRAGEISWEAIMSRGLRLIKKQD